MRRLSLIMTCLIIMTGSSLASDKESVYDRVMRTGTLRCSYVIYEPAVMKDPNTGAFSGFSYDIVNRLGENLGLKVKWIEEVGTGTMIEGFKSDRYDMICTPFWRDSERGRASDFSAPFYYSPMGIWVRPDDHRFDHNLAALNDPKVTLSVMDGTTLTVLARQDFPKAKTLTIPQLSPLTDLLLNVAMKKADAVAIDNYLAKEYLAGNPRSIREITADKPIRVYANSYMFKLGEPAFKAMIDSALTELLNNGYVDEMITKYEKYPGTFYRVEKPYSPNKSR
jgi:polar amino acid transport system substrate-binding protein